MEEVPENGKESSHSAHANGINKWMNEEYRRSNRKRLRFRLAMRVCLDVIDNLALVYCMEWKFNKSCKDLNVDRLAHNLLFYCYMLLLMMNET
jgi:hypothetical protein